MKYQTAQTKLQTLSGRLHYLLLVSIGLLIANIFLVWLVSWSFGHQKRTIIPADFNQAITISDNQVDAVYLRQMGLFFISERLNLTPNNVEHNHQIILQYSDVRFYHEFVGILGKEKEEIIKQNISSVFYPEEVVPNLGDLTLLVKGSLARWVGSTPLDPMKKSYLIKFSYHSGNLKVVEFTEVVER